VGWNDTLGMIIAEPQGWENDIGQPEGQQISQETISII
jgi:hypothetical protein